MVRWGGVWGGVWGGNDGDGQATFRHEKFSFSFFFVRQFSRLRLHHMFVFPSPIPPSITPPYEDGEAEAGINFYYCLGIVSLVIHEVGRQ